MRSNNIHSNIDSVARQDSIEKKHYVLLPENEDTDIDDLQFQEYAGYVDKALSEKGFKKTKSYEESDILILLSYGISEPQAQYYSYSTPIYRNTGSSAYSFSYSGNSGNGVFTTIVPTYGYVGEKNHLIRETFFERFLSLTAYDTEASQRKGKMIQV